MGSNSGKQLKNMYCKDFFWFLFRKGMYIKIVNARAWEGALLDAADMNSN